MKKILVVDDNKLVLRSTARILGKEGYEILQASNGNEALGVIEREGIPDLVVTDWIMPQMNGKELIEVLFEKFGDNCPPIIVVSGGDEGTGIGLEVALRLGAKMIINKPYDPKMFVCTIKEIIS